MHVFCARDTLDARIAGVTLLKIVVRACVNPFFHLFNSPCSPNELACLLSIIVAFEFCLIFLARPRLNFYLTRHINRLLKFKKGFFEITVIPLIFRVYTMNIPHKTCLSWNSLRSLANGLPQRGNKRRIHAFSRRSLCDILIGTSPIGFLD